MLYCTSAAATSWAGSHLSAYMKRELHGQRTACGAYGRRQQQAALYTTGCCIGKQNVQTSRAAAGLLAPPPSTGILTTAYTETPLATPSLAQPAARHTPTSGCFMHAPRCRLEQGACPLLQPAAGANAVGRDTPVRLLGAAINSAAPHSTFAESPGKKRADARSAQTLLLQVPCKLALHAGLRHTTAPHVLHTGQPLSGTPPAQQAPCPGLCHSPAPAAAMAKLKPPPRGMHCHHHHLITHPLAGPHHPIPDGHGTHLLQPDMRPLRPQP
jgi:hypothetical protein